MKIEQNITLPVKPRVIEETDTNATYEIEALYPGYGQTLGNTIRRVILSSIPGVAITKVSIEGVEHEFTNIEGIKEDVLEIVLNMKRIRFHIDGSENQEVMINKKGIGPITAGDIVTSANITVVNKKQHIAEITNKNTQFNAKLCVEHGIGFVSHEDRNDGKVDIGSIFLDAIFSPIRRVYYEIEDMRVGNRVDFNRLRLHIETDGTISPRDVFRKAISIIITQFNSISDFRDENETEEEDEINIGNIDIAKERGSISELEVSSRVMNALNASGVKTLQELEKLGEKGIKEIKGMGDSAVKELKEVLSERGIEIKE